MNYPLDPNEMLRLKAIQELEVAKRIPDPAVDRITAFAREHFQVPYCFVTLIEAERQLILSRQGLDVSETPRSSSFCTHTILQSEVLVVLDAQADERFKDKPGVTGAPFIRFYAGAPLTYESDVRLGALCIIDRRRRRAFSRAEQAELTMLADSVVSVIVARAFDLPEPDLSSIFSIREKRPKAIPRWGTWWGRWRV